MMPSRLPRCKRLQPLDGLRMVSLTQAACVSSHYREDELLKTWRVTALSRAGAATQGDVWMWNFLLTMR